MNLTNRGKIYLSILVLSLVFSYLVITLNYFPYLGMAASLLLSILFVYKCKKVRTKDTKLYSIFALLFSLLIFVRSEPIISFFNFGAAIFFGFLLLMPAQKSFGLIDYLYAPVVFLTKSILTKSSYFLEFEKKEKSPGKVKFIEVAFGLLVSVFLLAIILPLLSSANPIFQNLVQDFWVFTGLGNMLKNIGPETIFIWLLRLIFFLALIFVIPKVTSLINKKGDYSLPVSFKQEGFPLLLPKVVLGLVLIIFFITQLQFYFATQETLRIMGLSHSQHAREIFTQLSLVAAIVILLIYNSQEKGVLGKTVNWLLGLQGVFLTLMALKSDFEYISAWGLTYKRLYGLTLAAWIAGVFGLLFENLRNKTASAAFVKKTIIFSGVVLLAVNLINFDYLIYHFRKARTGLGIDYTYLSTLSADSLSYGEQLQKLEEASAEPGYSLDKYNNINPRLIVRKTVYLQKKYADFDLRTLNLFEFLQYRQIKSKDMSQLREHYEGKFPLHP